MLYSVVCCSVFVLVAVLVAVVRAVVSPVCALFVVCALAPSVCASEVPPINGRVGRGSLRIAMLAALDEATPGTMIGMVCMESIVCVGITKEKAE